MANIIFTDYKSFLKQNSKNNIYCETTIWLEKISKIFYDALNSEELTTPEYLTFKKYFNDIYGDEYDNECSYLMIKRNSYEIPIEKRNLFYLKYNQQKKSTFDEISNICISKKKMPNLAMGVYALTNADTNLFLSIGHFDGWKLEKNLTSVNMMYIDIDDLDANIVNGDELTIKNYVKSICPNEILPNYITASGHGLHLVWLIDKFSLSDENGSQDSKKVKILKDLTKKLITKFGSDANCSDLGRYLRVATSNNQKPGKEIVKSRLFVLTDNKKFTIDELTKAIEIPTIDIDNYMESMKNKSIEKRKNTLAKNKNIDKTLSNPKEFNNLMDSLSLDKISFQELLDKKIFLNNIKKGMSAKDSTESRNKDILSLFYEKTKNEKPTESEMNQAIEIQNYIVQSKGKRHGKIVTFIPKTDGKRKVTTQELKKFREKIRQNNDTLNLDLFKPKHYTENKTIAKDPTISNQSQLKKQYNDFLTYAKLNQYVPEGNRNNFAVHLCYLLKKMNRFSSIIKVFNEISICFDCDFYSELYDIISNIYNYRNQSFFFTNDTLINLLDINKDTQKYYFTIGSEEERKKRDKESVLSCRIKKKKDEFIIINQIVTEIRNGIAYDDLIKNKIYKKSLIKKAEMIVNKQNEYIFNNNRIKDFRKRMNFIYGKKKNILIKNKHYFSHINRLEKFFAMKKNGENKRTIINTLNISNSTYYNYLNEFNNFKSNSSPFFHYLLIDMLEVIFNTKKNTSTQSKKKRRKYRFSLKNELKHGKLNSFDIINQLSFVDIAMNVLKIPLSFREEYKNIFKGFSLFLNINTTASLEKRNYIVNLKNNTIVIDANINIFDLITLRDISSSKNKIVYDSFMTKYMEDYYAKRLNNLFLTTDDYSDYIQSLEHGKYLLFKENKKRQEKLKDNHKKIS